MEHPELTKLPGLGTYDEIALGQDEYPNFEGAISGVRMRGVRLAALKAEDEDATQERIDKLRGVS